MPESSAGRMNAGDRRRRLLDAALELFSHKGYGGTTTKEIAAAAGVTEAIIFRHFPTKQALYTAVLDSKTGTMQSPGVAGRNPGFDGSRRRCRRDASALR